MKSILLKARQVNTGKMSMSEIIVNNELGREIPWVRFSRSSSPGSLYLY